jgi:glutaconate CoA-transferase subunit B
VARELGNGQLGYIGVGSSATADTFAVRIPIAAARLAQLTHAPDFGVFWGNLLDPDLSTIPSTWTADEFVNWPAAASLTTGEGNDMILRGQIDVTFDSAAQVDRYGNLNITVIGSHSHPRVRLAGSLAQTEHLASAVKPIVVVRLKPRTFVDRVDFITSSGYLSGGRSREEAGLPSLRDYRIITDKAIFSFEHESREMILTSTHPGVSVADVLANMAFEPLIAETTPETQLPSRGDLHFLRDIIDPEKVLLGGEL